MSLQGKCIETETGDLAARSLCWADCSPLPACVRGVGGCWWGEPLRGGSGSLVPIKFAVFPRLQTDLGSPLFPPCLCSQQLPCPSLWGNTFPVLVLLFPPTICTHQYCSQPSPKSDLAHTQCTSEWTQQVPGLLRTRNSHLFPKEPYVVSLRPPPLAATRQPKARVLPGKSQVTVHPRASWMAPSRL